MYHNYHELGSVPPYLDGSMCWTNVSSTGPWCVVFNMVFIHFSDCFLCFTHIIGTLVQFTLLLCYIGSYLFPGGVGTAMFIPPCPVDS